MADPVPIVYQGIKNSPTPIQEGGEFYTDQGEELPYALGQSLSITDSLPALTAAGFSGPPTTTDSSATNVSRQAPIPWDLEWIQGDFAEFSWIFTDVFWTFEDPGITTALYNNLDVVVSTAALTSNVVTLTTATPHGYSVGYQVVVGDIGAPFDGTFVATAATTNTLSYAVTHANVASASVDGTVSVYNMPTWESRNWAAQMRNPYLMSTYQADAWVPAYGYQYNWWRGHSVAASFDTAAEVIEVPDAAGDGVTSFGTLVTISLPHERSAAILPGSWYRWDLQSTLMLNDVNVSDRPRTHLRGRSRIITEWTVV